MTKTYLPEVHKGMVKMLYSAQLAWITTMMNESFSHPDETSALEMMLEAHAATIGKHLEGHPDRQALLRAYALEMMDLAEG